MNKTDILEAATFNVQPIELTGRKYRVRLIEGDRLGSSGYYPAETLRRDGPRIFKKGTPMYLDHQTPDEKTHKPFGSVTTFAGTLAEDAVYEEDGLYANIEVFEHQMPLIKSLKDHIGISIRATGRTMNEKIGDKTVPVFKELIEAKSADFVVKAGAGGKIMSILESATTEEENMELAEKIDALEAALPAQISAAIESALKSIALAEKQAEEQKSEKTETVVDYAKVVELAEALSASSLPAAGRARVLELHKANGEDIAKLITAEEAYIKANAAETGHEAGAEESLKVKDAEEQQQKKPVTELKLPTRWNKK